MPQVSVMEDFADARRRMEAWWGGSSLGRPAVSCVIRKPDAPPMGVDPRPRAKAELDPAYQLRLAQWRLDAHYWPAETMPGLYPDYAHNLCIPAALVGAELEYRPESTWMAEMPDIYERELPGFSTGHPVFRSLDETLRSFGEHLGDRGLLSAPPLLDGLTTLSMLRGPQALCIDVVERPGDVVALAARLDEVAIAAHGAFYATIGRFGHRQTVTWCGLYAGGRCEMVQCDFATMLSPAAFEQVVLPGLRRMTDYLDFACYHLDGTCQTRFLDLLCSLERLGAIQWNPQPGAPSPLAWVDFFREVRRRGRSLWVPCNAATAVELTRRLGPDGLMLSVGGVKTLGGFERLVAEIAQACRTRPSL